MKRCLGLACFTMAIVAGRLAAQELPKPTGDAIVAPDAKLEKLYTRTVNIQGGLTEGPAVARDGSIYFTDIPVGSDKGLIMRFDPKTGKTTVFTEDSKKANGLIVDSQNRLIGCEGSDEGGRAVARWDLKTAKREVITDKFNGKHYNAPNDLCLDRQGRIYFTDPRYLGDEPRELEHRAVYRIDTSGKVVEVTHDVSKPNGIALSPDGRTLYVADHDNGVDKIDDSAPKVKKGPMKIYAFPLGDDGLVSGARKTIVDYGDKDGCDGMCVDAAGNIYLTARDPSRPGVHVVDPAGKEVAFIPTGPANQKEKPVGSPSNVEFGIGDEINVLYVTVDTSLYRIKLKAKGFHVQFQ